jgi:hypothetical protein
LRPDDHDAITLPQNPQSFSEATSLAARPEA